MWGNLRGWIISACIAVGLGALLVIAILPEKITSPTHTLTLAMQSADIPDNPTNILPAPGKDCDAGDNYRQAIDEYQSHEQHYEDWAANPKASDVRDAHPAAVQMLVDAKDCGKMTLFSLSLPDVMTYDDRVKLQALNAVGTMCNRIALLDAVEANPPEDAQNDGKPRPSPDEARGFAMAAFNLGRHFYEERIVFEEWSDGISLMSDAVYALAKFEKDKSKIDAMSNFRDSINEFRRGKVMRLWEIVSGIGEVDAAKYAGDIFDIAQNSPEKMWRIEAILKLGRMKYTARNRGDFFGAKKIVAKMAAEKGTDPAIRAAADAANSLTPEQFRMIK